MRLEDHICPRLVLNVYTTFVDDNVILQYQKVGPALTDHGSANHNPLVLARPSFHSLALPSLLQLNNVDNRSTYIVM